MYFWRAASDMRELGNYLRSLRQSRGLTRSQVCRRLQVIERRGTPQENISEKSVERWETAQTLPQRDKLEAFLMVIKAQANEVEIVYRLSGDVKGLNQWQSKTKLWTPLPGDLLKSARLAQGWNGEELALRLGVRAATVSHYENHQRSPEPQIAERIEQVLGGRFFTLEPVPEELNPYSGEEWVNEIEKRIISRPHAFYGKDVLPLTMQRLQLLVSKHPDATALLFRLWRLWAGWADGQGDFALVRKISAAHKSASSSRAGFLRCTLGASARPYVLGADGNAREKLQRVLSYS